jgi:biotin carboxylase
MTDSTQDSHLVLLLGAGGMSAGALLTAAEAVTARLSVVWVGETEPETDHALRSSWRARFKGDWLATTDPDRVLDLVELIHRRRPVQGVATFGEPLIVVQAEAQRRLGLPGNDPEVVRAVQSKAQQRRALGAAGVETLRFSLVRTDADLSEAAAHVGFPAVLKPELGAGSFLVSLVRDEAELAERFHTGYAAYRRSPLPTREPLFVLEELIQGENWHGDPRFGDYCSVESLIHDGRITHVAVTDKLPLHPGFVEAGDLVPSTLTGARIEQILDHTDAVIRALGLRWGATHTELKLTPHGPACIELNARLGGASGHFVRAATDGDLAADVMRIALGDPAMEDYKPRRHALFGSLPPPGRRVRLERQSTREELTAEVPELRFCKTRFRPGDVLEPTEPYNLLTYLVTGPDVTRTMALSASVERAYRAEFSPA